MKKKLYLVVDDSYRGSYSDKHQFCTESLKEAKDLLAEYPACDYTIYEIELNGSFIKWLGSI